MARARKGAGDGGRGECRFELSGGRLCLDFANTVSWRGSARPIERLGHYRDLVAWSRRAGLVHDGEAARLVRAAARRPAAAARVLRQALRLREATYRIFSATAGGRRPARADLAVLNAALARALRRLRIAPLAGAFDWRWEADGAALDRMLWPVAWSAAGLLRAEARQAVRACAAPDCGWLFLDTTRNRSRRWCDMRICGNRAKARRHYARERLFALRRGRPTPAGPAPGRRGNDG